MGCCAGSHPVSYTHLDVYKRQTLHDAPPALAWLRDNELDDQDCQLRRVIRADGGSRAWINGRSVTLAQLTELASLLVEIHGQHEQQALLSRPSQLELLDAYARNQSERSAVQAASQHLSLIHI